MPRAHVVPDGDKLAALRGEADLTQLELARQAGYGLRTIGKIESGQPTGAQTLAAAATVLSRRLGRAITLTDLMKRPNGAPNGGTRMLEGIGLVEQMVRFLDLSDAAPHRPRAAERRSILVDHFRFTRYPACRSALHFPYGSVAQRAYGECLSHPELGRWHEVVDSSYEEQPRRGYRMQIDLSAEPAGRGGTVCNGVEYFGAFDGENGAALDVPVIWPTESLTVLVLLPEPRRCAEVRGLARRDSAVVQPLLLPGGKLIHWHMSSPLAGDTYQLQWRW
jgi:transcriptional regulator with XRE-family HTH domain